MNILFIHGNYPAQFRSLASDLGAQGVHDVRFLTARKDHSAFPINGVKVEEYDATIAINESQASQAENIAREQIIRGEIIQRSIAKLLKDGFIPKLVIFHGGNGLGLFIKQIIPDTCLIGYFEWYFSNRCANLLLKRSDIESYNFIQSRNLSSQQEIINCDGCVVPTEWQLAQFPPKIQPLLTTIFDGVDVDFFKPGHASLREQTIFFRGESGEFTLDPTELLITYATRGMEPLRGFPEFMRSLPHLLNKLPNLKVLIGGRDRSAYGPQCPSHNGSWKHYLLDQIPELQNHPRIFYTGLMDYQNYRLMLQRTNLHFYFTKPYVTSWSLFEAKACGAPLVTNRSQATSGTLPLDEKEIFENIEDIYSPEGIDKIIARINESPASRKQNLPEKYMLTSAKSSWQQLINQCLTQKTL